MLVPSSIHAIANPAALEGLPVRLVPVGALAKELTLLTMQQAWGLIDFGLGGIRGEKTVDQASGEPPISSKGGHSPAPLDSA